MIIELTKSGRETLDRYVEVQGARERQLMSEMSPGERKELTGLLRKLLASVESQSDAVGREKD